MNDAQSMLLCAVCLCLVGLGLTGCPQSRDSEPEPQVGRIEDDAPTPGPAPAREQLTTGDPAASAAPAVAADKRADAPPAGEASPTVFGFRPGDILPQDPRVEGASEIVRRAGGLAACWPLEQSVVPDAPPQRLFIFTDDDNRITGIQWDRPGNSLIGPEELVLDFIVPAEAYREPIMPDTERIQVGEQLRQAVTADDRPALDAALQAQLEAESALDKDQLRGPLVAGIAASRMDGNLPEHVLATIRTPEDIGEYTFYFVGYLPDESFFPLSGGDWTRDEELGRARSGWYTGAIMSIFTFFDLDGITRPGFDRTIPHHDFVVPRETRIRNLGGRRIRIEAYALIGDSAGEGAGAGVSADDPASDASTPIDAE